MSDTARDQAITQIASIVQMVQALDVDYDRLEELRDERGNSSFPSRALTQNPDHTTGWWEDEFPDEAEELAELEEQAGDYGSKDEARDAIIEDPLSVEVRSSWGCPGEDLEPSEARVVLCTGGPHVEIRCDLDNGSPITPPRYLRRLGRQRGIVQF